MHDTTDDTLHDSRKQRTRRTTDLAWHVGTFLIINGFLWLIDARLGPPGIQWAGWITAVWGFGLAFHVLDWVVSAIGRRSG